ncbi:HIT family protein [bacterium]|nr:HIT family protein [bacterium]
MADCIFCDIVAGKIPASKVYEDEFALAFMDLSQPERGTGHILVIPKAHVEDIHAIPEVTLGWVHAVAARMAGAVKQALNPDGVLIWQSTGRAAGQVVPHFHVHVMAQWDGDGYELFGGKFPPEADAEKIKEAARKIARHVLAPPHHHMETEGIRPRDN